MSKVLGTFNFKHEGEGCIMGKYMNKDSSTTMIECAKIKKIEDIVKDPFIGSFSTIWLDGIDDPNNANLLIKEKMNNQYFLTWTSSDGSKVMFQGEAMLVDGMLVGFYWSN